MSLRSFNFVLFFLQTLPALVTEKALGMAFSLLARGFF